MLSKLNWEIMTFEFFCTFLLIKVVKIKTNIYDVSCDRLPSRNDQPRSEQGSLKKKSWSSEKLIHLKLQAERIFSKAVSMNGELFKSTAAVSLIIIGTRLFACQKKEYECWPRFKQNDFNSRNWFALLFHSKATFTIRLLFKDFVIKKKLKQKHALMWTWLTASQTDNVAVVE